VIKPINGNHGRGITINIQNWDEALFAFKAAKEISRSVIVEKYIVPVMIIVC
jgi:cyanophycin synthetase